MSNLITSARLRAVAVLLVSFALAGAANAGHFRVSGGGAQLSIGGGLPLPIQAPVPVSGNTFPTLLIPVNPDAAKPGLIIETSAAGDVLKIPAGVLKVAPAVNQVGVAVQNPTLYAVETNLGFSWPASDVTIGAGLRTDPNTGNTNTVTTTVSNVVVSGNNIRYSNVLGQRFGGPARFSISQGAAQGNIPSSPVTVYARAATATTGAAPCTHPALGGTNAACVALLLPASPASIAAIGAPFAEATATTAPSAANPGVMVVQAAADGEILLSAFTGGPAPVVNAAQTKGFPLTTGKITVSAPAAGAPEVFVLSGADNRTAGGEGTIQFVAAALSTRTLSGPNANRGWVELTLTSTAAPVPTLSEWARIATVALMVALTLGFVVVRRRDAEV